MALSSWPPSEAPPTQRLDPGLQDPGQGERDRATLHRVAVERREIRMGRRSGTGVDGFPDGSWRSPGYRSSRVRGQVVVGLLAAAVGADAIATLLGVWGLGLIAAAEAGTLEEAQATAFDGSYALIGMLQVFLYLASAVAVLGWLSRVVENIPPLTGGTPRRSPREAIGWWFVPFANYVVPYQIVSEGLRRLHTGDADRTERLLVPWWLLWVAAIISGVLVLRMPRETIDQLRTELAATALSDAAYVIAGCLLIVIVRAFERRSAIRARALGLGEGPAAAWPRAAFGSGEPADRPATGIVEVQVVDGSGPGEPPPPPFAPAGSS